eukprot:jgi/Chrzof1/1613/Cz10g14180.t1
MNPQHNAPLSRHLPSQAQRVPFLRRQCDKSRGRCNWLLQASKLDTQQLQHVAEQAADAGTKVILQALDQPRNIRSKGSIGDIVTDTDKASETACIAAIQAAFPDHAILGEEGGVVGNSTSDYLWCIDPLDGTVNFAHGYPGFCVSIGVLRHATPLAGCVIEFTGGPGGWGTRKYTAARNHGAKCNGQPMRVSATKRLEDALLVTELVWQEAVWPVLSELCQDFTQHSMGIRMSGAAAVNLCHLATGVADGYYQYMLKPWDVAAGIIILEEAGGRVTTCDGLAYSVFDRSLLASNDALYEQMLQKLEPRTSWLIQQGIHLGTANVPPGYKVKAGAQLE